MPIGSTLLPATRYAQGRFCLAILYFVVAFVRPTMSAEPTTASKPSELFAPSNLVAWCIVPFDAKKRGPVERAEMLRRLGFSKFAYDYRAEHIPTFDAELEALAKQHIELTAWWFPGSLNAEAKQILEVIQKHKVHPQLWVTGGGAATKDEADQLARVKSEAARLRPIAEAAAAAGCQVGLYNHGGWFGEPENQIAIIEELKLPNVGIVYNLHHGHDQIDRFPALLKQMLPYLYVVNLNGMLRNGDKRGQKIVPLGQGEFDLSLLKTIQGSGYRGPIGILGHTQDDAEQRLQDNLDGLAWLLPQLEGKSAGPQPTPRTYKAPAVKDNTKENKNKLGGLTPPARHGHNIAVALAEAPVTPAAPVEFNPQTLNELLAAAHTAGSAKRGLEVFRSAKFACLSCHQVGKHGGLVGPALTDVGRRLKPAEVVEAVIWPKRQVKPEYSSWRLILSDGRSLQGYKRNVTATGYDLFDPATQQTHTLKPDDIEEAVEIGTLMPDGLANAMTPAQQRDVIRFLLELGHTAGLENEVRPADQPVEFAYERGPLVVQAGSLWEHPVNRNRLYDFYAKEALHFRTQNPRPHLLPAFPGLDGGKLGHWGNQNEAVWKDDRWNNTDHGTLQAGVFHGGGLVVNKAVCVRLGDQGELATCFDPETLTYVAVWKGNFLKFSGVRHGFMDGLHPGGELLPRPAMEKPNVPFTYHGFYRSGPRVVFAYRLGDVEMLDSPWVKEGQFERTVAPAAEHPLKEVLQGGTPQWPVVIKTVGELGQGTSYAVDTIPLPFENPWRSLMFIGDHDFLADGSAMVCTMQGDVWHATGLNGDLQDIRWRRFAAGLHQALGLVVHDNQVYVLGRDQITRLQDTNRDGEADYYECFSNKMVTSPAGHDFTCGLARDAQGRFYTASGKQGLLRISADGQQVDVLGTGFRNPDGLGLAADGAITVPCSEGDWTPASMICLVPANQTATNPPHYGYQGPKEGKPPALPLVYLPRGLDNSSGGQVAIPDGRWGAPAGQMVHTSFGQGSYFLLLRDEVGGQAQGAIIPMPGEFRSGAHRAKFNPVDGQLYVSGQAGWGSYTPDDGSFQRVRYTGAKTQLPTSFHVHENGVLVNFAQPVDKAQLAKLENHFAQAWNYRYGPGYGSPELAPSHPGVVGHDNLEIAAVHAIGETSVFVELPELQPVNQLHLLLQVDAGRPQELFVTVHKLDKPYTALPGYKPTDKVIAAHPQSVDLAMLGKTIPNPFRKKLANTVTLSLAAGKNLTFAERTLRCPAGALVKFTFNNPDVVPHNWVLVKPGTLASVGQLTNQMVADPEAVLKQYVPKSEDVLFYTDIVSPQQPFTIYFKAPAVKGRYPYLCTFPGHWMVMNGELIVE